ncbi:hypothetical protein [Microvirga alba]|uniref:Uncharacterized protein n=1 Tax=Microvirga alba TaxID=2791025 RepID=A0A931FNV1_9HYPH|nr:hypothetical protein [Microvirga alba]MBF9231758.1 hypothetical protein [Microvirga alba]
MKSIISLFCFIFAFGVAEAKDLNRQLAPDMARVYGFLIGQSISLTRIGMEFPALRNEAELARMRFSAKFGESEKKLEEILRSMLGSKFDETDRQLRASIEANAKKQALTRPDAAAFLELMAARARGEIADEFLKPLLIAKYADRPAAEFVDGWRQTFVSDGSGKARGVKIHLQIPKSFGSKESPRPHIVRNWTSQDGKGPIVLVLDIREVGAAVTQKSLDEEFGPDMVKDVVGPDGQVLNSGKFKHETYPGFWVQAVRAEERATMKVQIAFQLYQIFARDKAVAIGCFSTLDEGARSDPKTVFQELQPLCLQVLNTLVLPGAYE